MKLLKIGYWLTIIGFIIVIVAGIVLGVLGFTGNLRLLLTDPTSLFTRPDMTGFAITFFAAAMLGILGFLILAVGTFLYTFVPIFRKDLAKINSGGYVTVLSLLVVGIILSNIIMAIILLPNLLVSVASGQTIPAQSSISITDLVIGTVIQAVLLLALVYFRDIRTGVFSWSGLGFTSRSLPMDIVWGIVGGIGVLVIAAIVEYVMTSLGVKQTQFNQFSAVKNATLPQFLLVLGTVGVLAPFWEELFFRGYVFTSFKNQKGLWQGFVFSAAIFAAVHLDLAALVPIFIIGLSLAAIRYFRGSLLPAMVAHGVNNVMAILFLYLSAR